MSKEAATRAMREAKYAAMAARPKTAAPARPVPVAPAVGRRSAAAPPDAPADAPADGLCGHRSMNGRTCTRESGHAAKSHRYG